MTATESVKRYSESLSGSARRRYVRIAERFEYWLEGRDHTGEEVRGYCDYLRRHDYSDGTINLTWRTLQRYFKVNGWDWPFRRGDAPQIREQEQGGFALDIADIEAMVGVVRGVRPPLGNIDPGSGHHAFLCLATVWGLRLEEMQGLQSEYVDLENKLLFVATVKNGRQRYHHIPDFLVPHLACFDFSVPRSKTWVGKLFTDLKAMIAFTKELNINSYGMGWHAIRRAAIAAAWVFASENVIDSFYRYKPATMARRYGTRRVVGTKTERGDVSGSDAATDEVVYKNHPFLKFWMP